MSPVWISNFVTSPFRSDVAVAISSISCSKFWSVGMSLEVNVFNSKSCIKMATTNSYTATGIKIKENVTSQTSVKRGEHFYVSRKSFCWVQIHSKAAVLAPALVISFQSVMLRDVKESFSQKSSWSTSSSRFTGQGDLVESLFCQMMSGQGCILCQTCHCCRNFTFRQKVCDMVQFA